MVDDVKRCALPGCDVPIRSAQGRPERRYCTAAHRAAARSARRAAMREHGGVGGSASALPWLDAPAGPRPDLPARRVGDPGVGRPGELPARRVGDPGVGRPGDRLDTERPADRYAAGRPDAASGTGPVLRPVGRHGTAAVEPGAVAREAARRSRGARRDAPRTRRRTLALIGMAGILTGGYAAGTHSAAPEPATPAQAAPDASADAWAQRASVALASVNRQLETLAQAEDQWRALPASRRGTPPAAVTALEQRRAELQRRRATLQAQLDAYRSMRDTQKGLAAADQHLEAVEKALQEAPPPHRRTPEQAAAVAALGEQRDLRLRRRDAERAELHTLEKGLDAAARTPVPDDDATTAKITGDVGEVVRNGGRAPDPGRPDARPPDDPRPDTERPGTERPGTERPGAQRPGTAPERDPDDGRPPADADTGGPPDPREPRAGAEDRDETRRRAEAQRRATVPGPGGPAVEDPAPTSAAPAVPPPDEPAGKNPVGSKPADPAAETPAARGPGIAVRAHEVVARARAQAQARAQARREAEEARAGKAGTSGPGASRTHPDRRTGGRDRPEIDDPAARADRDDDAIEEDNAARDRPADARRNGSRHHGSGRAGDRERRERADGRTDHEVRLIARAWSGH